MRMKKNEDRLERALFRVFFVFMHAHKSLQNANSLLVRKF